VELLLRYPQQLTAAQHLTAVRLPACCKLRLQVGCDGSCVMHAAYAVVLGCFEGCFVLLLLLNCCSGASTVPGD
jgi:hypothetical protein